MNRVRIVVKVRPTDFDFVLILEIYLPELYAHSVGGFPSDKPCLLKYCNELDVLVGINVLRDCKVDILIIEISHIDYQ